MALDLLSMLPPGKSELNVGGHTGRVRFSEIADMTTIQKKKEMNDATPPTTLDELIIIAGNHAWAASKGAVEWYITRDTGETEQGQNDIRDTNGSEVTYKGEMPGAVALKLGIIAVAMNIKGIFWAELADGTWIQYGSKRFPCELKGKWQSGKNMGKARKMDVTVTAFETTMQFYPGTFTLV